MTVELRDENQRHQSVEEEVEHGLLLTTLEKMLNWAPQFFPVVSHLWVPSR